MPSEARPPETDRSGAWQQAYGELRIIAERLLRSERCDHTLQPTALVHETWLRFQRDRRLHGLDQAETLSCAARTMRDVLVEHARRKHALKRGGRSRPASFTEAAEAPALAEEQTVDMEALDLALRRLESMDDQLARIVELRFFGGLSEERTAEILGVSPRTVRRGWAAARQWLAGELGRRNA